MEPTPMRLDGVHDPERVRRAEERRRQQAEMIAWLRGQAADTNGEMAWYVVCHRGDGGESLAARMDDAGIAAWCPMRKVVKRRGRRRFTVKRDMPLFEGYFFVRLLRGWNAAFMGVMTFDGVTGLLGNGETPTPVPDEIVNAIKAFEGEPALDHIVLFRPGRRVAISGGTFGGFEGTVVRSENRKGELALELDVFGRMVACRMGIDSVRLID